MKKSHGNGSSGSSMDKLILSNSIRERDLCPRCWGSGKRKPAESKCFVCRGAGYRTEWVWEWPVESGEVVIVYDYDDRTS